MTHALLTIKKVTLYLMSNVIPVVLALLSGILFLAVRIRLVLHVGFSWDMSLQHHQYYIYFLNSLES